MTAVHHPRPEPLDLGTDIADLGMHTRIRNLIIRNMKPRRTVGDLVALCACDVQDWRGVGPDALAKIQRNLGHWGLALKECTEGTCFPFSGGGES
jgi:hypothetical protein